MEITAADTPHRELKTRRKRRFGFLGDLAALALVVPAVYVLSFGPALLQEKDTFAVLWTAARLDVTGAPMGDVGTSGQRWLLRRDQGHKPVDELLLWHGWTVRKPQASVGVYARDDQRNYVRFKPFAGRFIICQADRKIDMEEGADKQ